MKTSCWVLWFGIGGMSAVAGKIERLPLEDFARTPEASRAQLSPDGKHIAYMRERNGRTELDVLDIARNHTVGLNAGESTLVEGARKDVSGLAWVSDHRLIVSTTVWDSFYGVVAVDMDGRRAQPISGYEDERITLSGPKRLFLREMIHRFGDKDQHILMLDRHENAAGSRNRPDVMSVRTTDGTVSREVKNPGEVKSWGVDANGVVRVGILSHGDQSGAIYRENESQPWRTILPLQDRRGGLYPLGFDAAGNRIFVGALTERRRWTIFPLDPATGEMGEALAEDPEYDIMPEEYIPTIDGIRLCAPLFSPAKDALLGLRYVTEAPRVKWLDRQFAGYQAGVDRASPDTVNMLVDISDDGKRMLWFGYSDQNPGVYLLLDLEQRSLKPVVRRMSWIKPAQMAQMLVVKYPARDGLTIHGFLTVPAGHEPKHLPLVVMPHGGPWVRDVWGFDPLVQLLANRGYAVLQMNYRGSPGYGEELFRSAHREIGRKIQDDIEDATRWAIAAGVADPPRIAICGASYGGYSALFALGRNPELYRCGVSIAGVTDWPEIFDDRKSDPDYRNANRYWRREIGDPDTDRAFLESISPVNFADKIAVPVLIVQGRDDRVVPTEQAKLMVGALERAGRKPESLFVAHMGHNYGNQRARTEVFGAVADFLERELGAGVN